MSEECKLYMCMLLSFVVDPIKDETFDMLPYYQFHFHLSGLVPFISGFGTFLFLIMFRPAVQVSLLAIW